MSKIGGKGINSFIKTGIFVISNVLFPLFVCKPKIGLISKAPGATNGKNTVYTLYLVLYHVVDALLYISYRTFEPFV